MKKLLNLTELNLKIEGLNIKNKKINLLNILIL